MRDNNRLNLSWLCETACVSRSGYYSYLQNEAKRQEREEADRKDFLLIVEAYQFRGYDKGAKGIKMRLLHLNPPVNMNLKKIRRLMKKYRLLCPIRKANPYRRTQLMATPKTQIVLDMGYTLLQTTEISFSSGVLWILARKPLISLSTAAMIGSAS